MTEILIKDIINAIQDRIELKYPDAKYYKDGEVKTYPAFYIRTTNIDRENIALRCREGFRDTFYMRVEYREASETASVTGLNSKLNDVGMILADQLRYIDLYGKRFYTEITTNETVDDVRIFDFYVILNTTFIKEEEPIMETISSNETVKE